MNTHGRRCHCATLWLTLLPDRVPEDTYILTDIGFCPIHNLRGFVQIAPHLRATADTQVFDQQTRCTDMLRLNNRRSLGTRLHQCANEGQPEIERLPCLRAELCVTCQ
jgi:hypothetical protein